MTEDWCNPPRYHKSNEEHRDWLADLVKPANDNLPYHHLTLPPVVALSAPAGGGKSTAARYLVDGYGYTLVKFAGPLKSMLRLIGLTDAHIEGQLKEVPSPLLCGKTPRHAMQSLGAAWGRDCIGPDLWRNVWYETAADVLDHGGRVVVDDLRFPNEHEAVRRLGGVVVALTGRSGPDVGGHISEAYRPAANFSVWNGGSVDGMRDGLRIALEAYSDGQAMRRAG